MKKFKIATAFLCLITLISGIIFSSIGCKQQNSSIASQQEQTSNENEDELYKFKLIALERSVQLLYESAKNLHSKTDTTGDLYSKITAGETRNTLFDNYSIAYNNMENALDITIAREEQLEFEINAMFPNGFDENNEYEKNLQTAILNTKEYSKISKEMCEITMGCIKGEYTEDYWISRWNELGVEIEKLDIYEYFYADEIIIEMYK